MEFNFGFSLIELLNDLIWSQNLEAVQQFGKLWQLEPEDEIKEEKNPRPPDEDDIALLKTCIRKLSFLNPSFS